jgi:hypothetical protein
VKGKGSLWKITPDMRLTTFSGTAEGLSNAEQCSWRYRAARETEAMEDSPH